MPSSKRNEAEVKSSKEKSKNTTNDQAKQEPSDPTSGSNSVSSQPDHTRSLIMILAVVGSVVGLVYVYPYLSNMFGKQKEVFTSVDQLGQRHILLEEKVANLEQRVADVQDRLFKDVALKDSVRALSNRLEIVENQLKGPSSNGSLEGLKKQDEQIQKTLLNLTTRIDGLENNQEAGQNQITKIPKTILTFSELRDSVLRGRPFTEELNKIFNLVDLEDKNISSNIDELKVIAASGVPSYDQLAQEFSVLMNEIRHQAIPKDLPWYKKFVERLRALVVVKRDGEPIAGGTNVDFLLTEIHNELIESDLETALKLSEKLPVKDSPGYQIWKSRAENRLLIDNMYPILETSALTRLLQTKSSEKTKQSVSVETKSKEEETAE